MAQKVLITGGTGLIGRHLTKLLLEKNYDVALLSRSKEKTDGVKVYGWDVEKNFVDPAALENVYCLIHLAGAGIADERWTEDRKKEIIDSRTKTIELIASKLKEMDARPKVFISASASGYYGADTGNRHHIEAAPAGNDFLSEVTVRWEKAADDVAALGVRTIKIRAGIVLAREGGALEKMAQPARFGFGAALGSGNQWVSWIHINDICRMYLEAMENESWEGPYNAVTSNPVTNQELTNQICAALHRPQWLPNVPTFALRIVFGEMASVVLGSNYVVNWRITKETDFKYEFSKLEPALAQILEK